MSKVLRFMANFPYVIVIGEDAEEEGEDTLLDCLYFSTYSTDNTNFFRISGAYIIDSAEMLGYDQ